MPVTMSRLNLVKGVGADLITLASIFASRSGAS